MTETVTISINGTEHAVERGITVLEAARRVGVYIPTFCYHKHLSLSGNCRMCLVEIKPGSPKPAISCATPVAEGMQVFTESQMVIEARRAVLEFLLMNHPLDCPVCDEAYECKLQDYTYAYGSSESRFVPLHDEKRVYIRRKMGRLFVEMNRCIACTRCVRYFREVAGEYELGRTHRGHKLKIDSYKSVLESPFSINAADLCPVGALEDAKFRFTARNWELVRTPSVCPSCSIGCNVYIDAKEGAIKRLVPRENDAVNACYLCDHGRTNFDFVQVGRLDAPLQRRGGEWVSLDEAALRAALKAKIGGFIATEGPQKLALLLSPTLTTEALALGREIGARLDLGRVGLIAGVNHRPRVPVLSDVLPKTLVSDDKTPNSTGAKLLGLACGEEDFSFGHSLLAAMENGAITGLIVVGEDWLARGDFENATLKAALGKLKLLVVASSHATATTACAEFVLPLAAWAEQDGTYVNHEPRLQRLRRAVPMREGARGETEMMATLGAAAGLGELPTDPEAAFALVAAAIPGLAGLRFDELPELGLALTPQGTRKE